MLCCVVSSGVVSCCVVLCCVVLCGVVECCEVLCCVVWCDGVVLFSVVSVRVAIIDDGLRVVSVKQNVPRLSVYGGIPL